MNILENITFSTEKPNVLYLRKNEKVKYFAIALGKNAVLKKHTAPVVSTLVVLKGEINFILDGKVHHLKPFDVFEIPLDIEHEVHGISDENLFTVNQEF